MTNLVKNYINLLDIDKLKSFALKNDINLNDEKLNYLLDLVKNNFDDIILNDEKYLSDIKDNIDSINYEKIENLYYKYKKKYKGYLF